MELDNGSITVVVVLIPLDITTLAHSDPMYSARGILAQSDSAY